MLQRTIGVLLLLLGVFATMQGIGLVDLVGHTMAFDPTSSAGWASIADKWSLPHPLDDRRSPPLAFGVAFAFLGSNLLVRAPK